MGQCVALRQPDDAATIVAAADAVSVSVVAAGADEVVSRPPTTAAAICDNRLPALNDDA